MESTAPNSTAPSSPVSTAPSLDEQISETMAASLSEQGPVKRKVLTEKLTALHQAKHPEPSQPEPGGSPVYEPLVPLSETQAAIAQDYAADLHGLDVAGVSVEQKGTFLDFAISGALRDNVDLRDEAQCFQVGRTRHGSAWDGLVDDSRRAVVALGPQVKDYLEQSGVGNSPSVIEALAMWQRGHFKLSPQEARQKMATEKDPALRRLLAMLASQG